MPERGIGRHRMDAGRIRAVAHDEEPVVPDAAASARDVGVGVVGRHDDVGAPKREAFPGEQGAVQGPPAPELLLEELGRQVVVIEDQRGSAAPERQPS